MKSGKISETVLKRTVLKQLHINKPVPGQDFGAADVDGEKVAIATATTTMIVENMQLMVKDVIYGAFNNVAISGGKPVGITLNLVVPTIWNEAQLKDLMKIINEICENEGLAVLSGHTVVSGVTKSLIMSVTAVADILDKTDISVNNIKPGMDIIATKWIGLEGTALLAYEGEDKLRKRYSQPFINKAKDFEGFISIRSEAAVASKSGAVAMHDISEGGIFGALWEFADQSGVGLDIDLKNIPIRQETVEICEFFDINPYKLLSKGSLLIASYDGNKIVRELEQAGIEATVIGVTTDSNDRVLISGEERRFLETPQTDEIYKVIK